ncbi:putative naringenin-chalcone synthase [Fodinibius salinus]|uniref:Putative naringenin-chalcone synthase n=1 Tax=Fodinibius salinus TaxID=860790 RepID=A0A5D3YKZ9_9BACT|nr:type III polyketide synthase [Fodinibius salinus]TYP94120.1 putative naringenin-chalcone synthase [Fodinibius salinus]
MSAYIQNISTAVPQHYFEQDFLRERMKEHISTSKNSERIIHRIYSKSGIKKRHTVIDDFNTNGSARFFFKKDGSLNTPSTGSRNEVYARKAKQLFVKTARKTIRENNDISKADITHIITVSCTGFFAPEPGFEIIQQLELDDSTKRFHLGFMGCFAAFPAMKMARSFCTSNPDARVLVVCLELCTLHLQDSDNTDQLISASVFADGAGGMIIGSKPPSKSAGFEIKQFATAIADESQDDMSWTIGDTGFEMVLSTYVPEIIESNLTEAIQPMLDDYNLSTKQIAHWAVHPGGRAILDKIQQSFTLEDKQLAAPRTILAEYGNMSSATILFVLAELLKNENITKTEPILSMAFGPGLTIESGLLTKVGPA